MSTPVNKLAKYRTYSYHHVLALCNSADNAELWAKSSTFDGSTDGVTVLFDGRKNAQYVATYVKLASVIAPSVPGEHYHGTILMEAEIHIQEPRGVRFLNELNKFYNKYNIDPASAVFALKTIFVGYSNTGQDEEITDIPASLMTLYDLTAAFDTTGAKYVLTLSPLVNGTSYTPEYSTAVQNIASINVTKKDATLQDAMSALISAIDTAYQKYLECVKKEIPSITPKEVKYAIKLNEPYTSDAYKLDLIKDQITETGENNGIIKFAKNETMETAIERLMNYSKQVVDDGNNPAGTRKAFKINTIVQPSADQILITYVITQYKVPLTVFEKVATGDPSLEEPGNVLNLEYIFSGKNIDILDFDIKMAMGLLFVMSMEPTNNVADKPENTNDGNKATIAQSAQPASTKQKTKTIIPFAKLDTRTLTKHTKDPTGSTNFQQMMSRFASIEGLDTKITIAGNPAFLANLIRYPSDAINNTPTPYGEDGGVIKDYDKVPPLCKIKVFMPASDSVTDFTQEPFWFQGHYYIFSVESIFESGAFTQDLEMISLPTENEVPSILPKPPELTPGAKVDGDTSDKDGTPSGTNKKNKSAKDVPSDANADPQKKKDC